MVKAARLEIPPDLAEAYAASPGGAMLALEYGNHEVISRGDPSCTHGLIHYINNAFDGQAWWCDVLACRRHERLGYTPGTVMSFPSGALIRAPTKGESEDKAYAWKADHVGKAQKIPPVEQVFILDFPDNVGSPDIWPKDFGEKWFAGKHTTPMVTGEGVIVEYPELAPRRRTVNLSGVIEL